MTIYISGKITGIEDTAHQLFQDAEDFLTRVKGHRVVNPLKLEHNHDKSWHSYLREDIKALCDCDAIYMLDNWTDSKGAIIEPTIAIYIGIKVIYQSQTVSGTV